MIDKWRVLSQNTLRLALVCLIVGLPISVTAQEFSDNALQMGIDYNYGSGPNAGGVSFMDFDQDGLDDLSFAGNTNTPSTFYRNTGNGFEKVNLQGIYDGGFAAKHILWVDFDNDGDLDLYITYFEAINKLYRNEGNNTFTDVSRTAGLSEEALTSLGSSWVDYDRDGFLDLYVLDRRAYGSNAEATNRLYHNEGNGQFTERTLEANVADSSKYPFCSTFFDFDADGWEDVFIAQDLSPFNTLLRNQGDGQFAD